VLIDWESCAIGFGYQDLACFFGIIPIHIRRQYEAEMNELYYKLLLDQCNILDAETYSFQNFMEEYIQCFIEKFVTSLIKFSMSIPDEMMQLIHDQVNLGCIFCIIY
jgi:hypothetical protein